MSVGRECAKESERKESRMKTATLSGLNGHRHGPSQIKIETNTMSTGNPLSPLSPIRPGTSSSAHRRGIGVGGSYGNSPISPSIEDRGESGRSGTKRACNECRQQKVSLCGCNGAG